MIASGSRVLIHTFRTGGGLLRTLRRWLQPGGRECLHGSRDAYRVMVASADAAGAGRRHVLVALARRADNERVARFRVTAGVRTGCPGPGQTRELVRDAYNGGRSYRNVFDLPGDRPWTLKVTVRDAFGRVVSVTRHSFPAARAGRADPVDTAPRRPAGVPRRYYPRDTLAGRG